jgi:MarR family
MSRGIGKTQRRILDELAANDRAALTVIDLAEWIGVSDRQMRRAVHALADRGLVVLTKENGGWAGEGRYGPFWSAPSLPENAYGRGLSRNDAATGQPMLLMITEMAMFSQAPPVCGGTDQVQRNIIGVRVLGLPKEANNDKTAAYTDLPKNQ